MKFRINWGRLWLLMALFLICLGVITALSPKSHADVPFIMCDDGREGIVGGHTTCEFAANVRKEFFLMGGRSMFQAYSPVTNQAYDMTCAGSKTVTFVDGEVRRAVSCYTDTGAEVVIW